MADRAGIFGGAGVWFTATVLAGSSGLLVLRAGRVVGEAGAAGAVILWLAVAALASVTSLSLSAILTNARSGSPSTLLAIRGSLGSSVASLVAAPMWLARTFAAATAAFAIAEAAAVFEGSEVLVALGVVFAAGASARLAQPSLPSAVPLVLVAVAVGLASMLAGETAGAPRSSPWILAADYGGLLAYVVPIAATLWVAPDLVASTGETRRDSSANRLFSGPSAQPFALGCVWLVHLATIAWFSQVAPASTLVADSAVGLHQAALPLLSRLGLAFGAAFLAIASLSDGGRIAREGAEIALPSFSTHPWLPELATAALAAAAIVSIRHLDGVATAWTLALLFTFTAVNTVVAIELFLGMSSFRPESRPQPLLPALAALASASGMLLTHTAGALLLTAATFGLVFFLIGSGRSPSEYSALVTALSEWLARRTSKRIARRAWKPALLVPLAEVGRVRALLELLADIARPEGSVRFLGVGERVDTGIVHLSEAMESQHIDTEHTWIESSSPEALSVALETLKLAIFRPNLVVLQLPAEPSDDPVLSSQVIAARRSSVGVLLIGTPKNTPVVGHRRTITLWIRAIPGRWDPLEGYEGRNLDLALLIGYRLARTWGSQLRLVTVVTEPEHRLGAEQFLAALCALCRLPPETLRQVIVGTFEQAVDDLSNSDLDIFGLQPQPDLERARRLVTRARSTCLFVLDSGRESALL